MFQFQSKSVTAEKREMLKRFLFLFEQNETKQMIKYENYYQIRFTFKTNFCYSLTYFGIPTQLHSSASKHKYCSLLFHLSF